MWAPWDVAQFRRPFPVVSLARALYTEHLCYPKSTYIFLNCSFLITKNSHLQKEKAEDLSRPELQYRYAHFRYESLWVYSPFLLKCTYILSCSLPFPYPFWIFFSQLVTVYLHLLREICIFVICKSLRVGHLLTFWSFLFIYSFIGLFIGFLPPVDFIPELLAALLLGFQ